MHILQYLSILLFCFAAYSAAADYDFALALNYSLLFYEAQRSGKLPEDQQVTWRKDSALDDQGQDGEDLTGGYYDGPGFVKYGFPMAYTITTLSWGAILYEQGYEDAGLTDAIQEAIKWGTDYFLKCNVAEDEFYGQVGNGTIEQSWWGRPEDMTMERPAYKITPQNPGSELTAETAAALAAASIVFKTVDPDYSATLLEHARQVFSLANDYRGFYNESIPEIANFYNSYTGYHDEIVWAAAWIAKASGDEADLETASSLYEELMGTLTWFNFGWDDKSAGVQALFAELTDEDIYKTHLNSYAYNMLHTYNFTEKGLLYIGEWGTLMIAADTAFMVLRARELGLEGDEYLDFAKAQIGYILGDSGRSYVGGYGEEYPSHEFHRSSSCPDAPAPCDWSAFNSEEPNPHILYGALVGGPDQNDMYHDNRTDYQHNEVHLHFNAAFTGVLAYFVENVF